MKKRTILILCAVVAILFSACGITQEDLEDARKDGYTSGYEDGYEAGSA